MSDSWASTDLGPEKAFMARTLAHPEVSFTASHKLMTFEEYSILYSLSPAEPLGSRIDEYATQYLQAGIDLLFSGTTRSHITRLQADVNRMALLINAPVLSDWEPNHTELINKTSQWVGPVVGPTITYKEWLFFELIAHVWLPYTAAPPPSFTAEDGSTVSTYGPCLNHRDLRFDERFATPGQWPAPLYPRPSWQPDPNMEPPLLRPATEVDILEPCPICRYIPIELGETISVLPCEGGLDKHIFHPHCKLKPQKIEPYSPEFPHIRSIY